MKTTDVSFAHILLDAARMGGNLAHACELNESHASLYKGRSEIELANFAPHIFSLTNKLTFVNWILETGWGNSWGVFLQSAAPNNELFRHFRQFLMIILESGEEAYFRFYDPRVLRVFCLLVMPPNCASSSDQWSIL